MNRFADIDVSFKRLPPVYGYRSEKLVSIEKALEPIESQISDLSHYIKTAKKHCHFPTKHGLSIDQSAAIYIYTMEWGNTSLYRLFNNALRSEDRQALKIWFPYLKLFDTALDKLPTNKEILWRGSRHHIGKDFTKDKLVTWWSVNSCSLSVDVIKKFLSNNTTSTLFLIEAINGKKISDYSAYKDEDEFILRWGTQFRVKSNALEQSNKSYIVHLIEIDDTDESLPVAIDEMQVAPKPSNQDTMEHQINEPATIEKNEEHDNITNNEDTFKSIKNNIIQILGLHNDNENKDIIIYDLLENGRQSLINYQDNIISKIYNKQMNDNNSELIKILKKYFEQKWQIDYGRNNQWFILFLKQYNNEKNHNWYEYILNRTAQYGNKYMKNCSILSIVLQILFNNINDQCLNETNIFNDLWISITNDGLKSIKKYSDYINLKIMNEQINTEQSILSKALREYYRENLIHLLKQTNIIDIQDFYDSLLDNIIKHGWINGIKIIQEQITPKQYKLLLQNLQSFLQQQNVTSHIQDNTESITTTICSTDTIVKRESTIVGIRTLKANAHSEVPTFTAYEWGLENCEKYDAYNGRTWSSQYEEKTYSWTIFYIGVPTDDAVRIVGGRMQASNDSSSCPFITLYSWGKQYGEECIISDGYCWTKQYNHSYQKTSFFLAVGDETKNAPNIVGGRMRITNDDSLKPWITVNEWGRRSPYEVFFCESENRSETYGDGYQYASLFFDRHVQNSDKSSIILPNM